MEAPGILHRCSISAAIPDLKRTLTHTDLHRLACYLLEDAGADAHAQQIKWWNVWPLLVPPAEQRQGRQRVQVVLNWLAPGDPTHRIEARCAQRPNLGLDAPLTDITIDTESVSLNTIVTKEPPRRFDVEFVSPTWFSRQGRTYPFPEPKLVLDRLAARWNGMIELHGRPDLEVPLELQRAVGSAIAIESFDLRTVPLRAGASKAGCVGTARFRLVDPEPGVDLVVSSLLRFAEWAGIGANTTHGYGAVQTRW